MQGRPGVLLVGDDDGDEIAAHIDDSGFGVKTVDDLDDVLDALAATTFDCVVSVGTVTADDTAADVVEMVRRIRETQSDLPVVLYADESEEAVARGIVAAGVADLVRRTDGDDHDRLLGRVRNAVSRRQAVRRAEQQARLNEVIRDLNQVLVRGDSRDEIEDAVCEQLARSEQYNFAWIAAIGDDGVALRAMGVEGGTVEGRGAVAVDRGTAFTDPVEQAAAEREVVVVRDVEDRGGAWEAALGRSFSTVAAVPFVYEDTLYGVLVLYTDRAGAFDDEEQRVLAELGENIAYAMNAVAVRRRMALRERELRRQNDRLERFASVVSHDLRNPLNVAQGYVDVIHEEGDDDVAGFADEVETSLDRMETILEDVLELARQGETIDEPETVNLAAVAEAAWGTVDTDGATLTATDATLLADESRFTQLLENLFRNAREHGDAGAVRVGPIREGDRVTGFFVEDDGPGIPEDERDDVLEMGYTNSQDGTGFGLAIVTEIAGAHGWQPNVTAGSGAEGRFDGARFEFLGVETHGDVETVDG